MMVSVGALRICLCIIEDDLRSWVMEELLLMTWVEAPALTSAASLSAFDPNAMSLVLVGVDRLGHHEREHLRTRTWRTPVIAIGREVQDLSCEHILGPRLTSRELKQALRATLFAPSAPRESAVG